LHTAQLMPLSFTVSCFSKMKSRLVLPFWYRLAWVVPYKRPLNERACVSPIDLTAYAAWIKMARTCQSAINTRAWRLIGRASAVRCPADRRVLQLTSLDDTSCSCAECAAAAICYDGRTSPARTRAPRHLPRRTKAPRTYAPGTNVS